MQNNSSKRPFTIESLLDSAPPPPKRGRFFIDNLLDEQQTGSGAAPPKSAKDYVRKLDDAVERNNKFKFDKMKSSFAIEDVPTDPEGLLAGILVLISALITLA